MAERSSTGLLMMMLDPSPAVAMTLPAEVREKLAELELELSEGESLISACSFAISMRHTGFQRSGLHQNSRRVHSLLCVDAGCWSHTHLSKCALKYLNCHLYVFTTLLL